MNKKIVIFNFMILISSGMSAAQINAASLQPVINQLQNDLISLSALSAVSVQISASTFLGYLFFLSYTDAQKKNVWTRGYNPTPESVAVINQALQSEGGVYIVINPISKFTNWRVIVVYGAKSLSLVDSNTFDLLFAHSGGQIPVNQVAQFGFFNIQTQLTVNGKGTPLSPYVPIGQVTLLTL